MADATDGFDFSATTTDWWALCDAAHLDECKRAVERGEVELDALALAGTVFAGGWFPEEPIKIRLRVMDTLLSEGEADAVPVVTRSLLLPTGRLRGVVVAKGGESDRRVPQVVFYRTIPPGSYEIRVYRPQEKRLATRSRKALDAIWITGCFAQLLFWPAGIILVLYGLLGIYTRRATFVGLLMLSAAFCYRVVTRLWLWPPLERESDRMDAVLHLHRGGAAREAGRLLTREDLL